MALGCSGCARRILNRSAIAPAGRRSGRSSIAIGNLAAPGRRSFSRSTAGQGRILPNLGAPRIIHFHLSATSRASRKFSNSLARGLKPYPAPMGVRLNEAAMHLSPCIRCSTCDGYLKRFFTDDRVRLAFCFQSKYLGMSPFRCPSLFSILSFLEYEHGVFHPTGGGGAVTSTMA